jgi:hypothetical protein
MAKATRSQSGGPLNPRPSRTLSVEQNARSALLGGACVLALGLGLVGVGATTLGALPVMVGLGLTILAIHLYGRLGPDDAGSAMDAESDLDERREVARSRILRGGLTLIVSVAVAFGTYAATDAGERVLVMAAPVLWGVAEVVGGRNMLAARKRPKAKVEKRRRMDKSPAP